MNTPQRHHWLNSTVGILDEAFTLTQEEQYAVATIVRKLLDTLRIPDRGLTGDLPLAVVQEMHNNYYADMLDAANSNTSVRRPRPAMSTDAVMELEPWRAALEEMYLVSYPDLIAEERLILRKTFTDLLAALGVPNRAAEHFPTLVITAYRQLDNR